MVNHHVVLCQNSAYANHLLQLEGLVLQKQCKYNSKHVPLFLNAHLISVVCRAKLELCALQLK